jgi:type III pantothenate kinase
VPPFPRPNDAAVWLTLDLGNSTLDCAVHDAAGSRRQRLAAVTDVELTTFVGQQIPSHAAVASVVDDPRLAGVLQGLRERNVAVLHAGTDLPCPLRLAYPRPETLGVDRWVGAYAAFRRFGAAVVVDCGTATTVNRVDAAGTFVGGAIAPGVRTMLEGLLARAPRLPNVDLDPLRIVMPATTTEDAIRAGVLLTAVGGIRQILDALDVASTGARVLTGGAAPLVAPLLREFEVVDDLVHGGLRWLLHDALRAC